MKIVLTKDESERYFHTALCNAVSMGYMRSYGLELTYNEDQYKVAKTKLIEPCMEDVWLQILKDGGTLSFEDKEGSEGIKSITLKQVHTRVAKMPLYHLMDMINEEDDATTADVLLQTVFYGEVVFG